MAIHLKKQRNSIKPIDNYSKYKSAAEDQYIASKVNYTILRLCNIYNGKTGLVKNLLTSIKNNKSIFLTNSKAYRNYMHVDDLINVIFRMLNTN